MRPLWASVKMAAPAPGNRARGAAPSTPTTCTIFALHIHRMQYICAVDALHMQFVCASHMRTRHALCMHYSIYALHALHVTHTHSSYLHTAGSLDMYDTYPYALYAHYVQSTGTTVHHTCALCCRPNVSPQNSHVAPAPQGGGIRRWGLR